MYTQIDRRTGRRIHTHMYVIVGVGVGVHAFFKYIQYDLKVFKLNL